MRSEDAMTGVAMVRLMERLGREWERRDAHSLISQEASG